MNPERLIADAKALALSLVPDYAPGAPRTMWKWAAPKIYALLKMGIYLARQGGYISRLRCRNRRETGIRFERRPPDRRADRLRAISAGSGARSVPEPVRPAQNAGAHAAHAENRKAAKELGCWVLGAGFWLTALPSEGRLPAPSTQHPAPVLGVYMQEAVIIDCLRTAVGKAPRGALRNSRPDDLAGAVIRALLEKYPQVPKDDDRRRGPRLRHAGSRIGQQHGAQCGPARRPAGYRHRRDHQPLLQFRPASHRHGGRPHPHRRRGHHHRRRRGIHEPDSARRAQIRAQSLVRRSSARRST